MSLNTIYFDRLLPLIIIIDSLLSHRGNVKGKEKGREVAELSHSTYDTVLNTLGQQSLQSQVNRTVNVQSILIVRTVKRS